MNTQSPIFLKSVFGLIILYFASNANVYSSMVDTSLLAKREDALGLLQSMSVSLFSPSCRSASLRDSFPPANDLAKALVRSSCSAPKLGGAKGDMEKFQKLINELIVLTQKCLEYSEDEDMETNQRPINPLMGIVQRHPEYFAKVFGAIGGNLQKKGAQCKLLKSPSTIEHRRTNSADISGISSDSESRAASDSGNSPLSFENGRPSVLG